MKVRYVFVNEDTRHEAFVVFTDCRCTAIHAAYGWWMRLLLGLCYGDAPLP